MAHIDAAELEKAQAEAVEAKREAAESGTGVMVVHCARLMNVWLARLEAAENALARVASGLRAEVARRARLRFAPALVFHHDARRSAEGFAPEHLAELVVGEGLGPPGRR